MPLTKPCRPSTPGLYLVIVYHDVTPALHGPFASEEERFQAARAHRRADPHMHDGLYWLDVGDGSTLEIDAWPGGVLDPDGDGKEWGGAEELPDISGAGPLRLTMGQAIRYAAEQHEVELRHNDYGFYLRTPADEDGLFAGHRKTFREAFDELVAFLRQHRPVEIITEDEDAEEEGGEDDPAVKAAATLSQQALAEAAANTAAMQQADELPTSSVLLDVKRPGIGITLQVPAASEEQARERLAAYGNTQIEVEVDTEEFGTLTVYLYPSELVDAKVMDRLEPSTLPRDKEA